MKDLESYMEEAEQYQNYNMKNTESKENLSKSMIATLQAENLSVVGDLAEVGIDAVIDDGILRDIPILSAIIGVGKVIGNISSVLFTRRLAAFLFNLKDIDSESRKKAIEKWEEDSKYRIHVGETLLNMINRCDDTQKARWLSKLFYELVLQRGMSDVFMRVEKVLSSLSVMDVMSFLDLPKEKYNLLSVEEAEPYANSGLYVVEQRKRQTAVEVIVIPETKMQITEVGAWIYSILNNRMENV